MVSAPSGERLLPFSLVALATAWPLAAQTPELVIGEQEIGTGVGGLTATLDDVDRFGHSLGALGDLDGDGVVDVAVGASLDDDGGTNRGAVYILFMNADGTVKAEQKISQTEGGFSAFLDDSDQFGTSIAPLGDLDGDGVTELAVGAELDDDFGTNSGAVWILFLNSDGTVSSQQKISAASGGLAGGSLASGDLFGSAVAGLGDFDGDGVGDLAVGADQTDDGGVDRGAVWILYLNPDGRVKSQQKLSELAGGLAPLNDEDAFGGALAVLGDLNADGNAELAVGATGDDDGGVDRGAVYLLFLDDDGTVGDQAKLGAFSGLSLLSDLDRFGSSVATVGDLDGNGTDDIAVGASGDDDDGTNKGAVWLVTLDVDGTLQASAKISAKSGNFEGPLESQDRFGIAVTAPGDLDGDGADDLVVGADMDDGTGFDQGAVWALLLNQCTVGSVANRNGTGVNRELLTTNSVPVFGKVWDVSLDCTGHAPGLGAYLGRTQPLDPGLSTPFGELLVDLGSGRLFTLLLNHGGGTANLFFPVPRELAFCGTVVYSQGGCLGDPGPEIGNALDFSVGF